MNKVDLIGRLTRNPEVWHSHTQTGDQSTVARYTLAVDRKYVKYSSGDNQQNADFIPCVAFGRQAEFTEKYLTQGIKIAISGRLQTGNYINKDGQRTYTMEVVVEEQEFSESRKNGNGGIETSNEQKESYNPVGDIPTNHQGNMQQVQTSSNTMYQNNAIKPSIENKVTTTSQVALDLSDSEDNYMNIQQDSDGEYDNIPYK